MKLHALALSALFASTLPAASEGLSERVYRGLVADGFTELRVSRTLLGRVLIVATDGERVREIVFDPRREVILRDWSESASTHAGTDARPGGRPDHGPSTGGGNSAGRSGGANAGASASGRGQGRP